MLPNRHGKIILLASLLTYQGGLTVPAYAAAKGGIGQLVKALSNEWSPHNVHVNGIVPGYVETDMNEALMRDEGRLRAISERIPGGRWGRPEDFAGPAVFLASAASQYVCGELLVVDGVRTHFFLLSSFFSFLSFHFFISTIPMIHSTLPNTHPVQQSGIIHPSIHLPATSPKDSLYWNSRDSRFTLSLFLSFDY